MSKLNQHSFFNCKVYTEVLSEAATVSLQRTILRESEKREYLWSVHNILLRAPRLLTVFVPLSFLVVDRCDCFAIFVTRDLAMGKETDLIRITLTFRYMYTYTRTQTHSHSLSHCTNTPIFKRISVLKQKY